LKALEISRLRTVVKMETMSLRYWRSVRLLHRHKVSRPKHV